MSQPAEANEAACVVCQQPCQRALLYMKWGYAIVRCTGCKHVSTVVSADDSCLAQPDQFYSQRYFEGGMKDGYQSYEHQRAALVQHFSRLIAKRVLPLKSAGHLLDVGCAYGYCVEAAQGHFVASGIDVSPHAIDVARSRGLDCSVSTLEDYRPSKLFDVITLLDCIEHLPRPQHDVRCAFDLLRRGGILVVTTGDIRALYPRLAGKHWRLMTPPQHLHFFSEATLTRLLESAGFQRRVAGRDWKRVPLALAAYQLCGRLGAPSAWTGRLPGALPINLWDTITIVAERV